MIPKFRVPPKKTKELLAANLMAGCQRDEDWGEDERSPWTDHQAVADAILAGDSVEEILAMDELERWPDTWEWLHDKLEE